MQKKNCKRCGGSGKEPNHTRTGQLRKRMRTDAGISQMHLATEMGVHFSMIYMLENGIRNWNDSLLERHDKALKAAIRSHNGK